MTGARQANAQGEDAGLESTLSEIEFHLTYADRIAPDADETTIRRMQELGPAATSLVPCVVELFENGQLRVRTETLVDLYVSLRDERLLSALTHHDVLKSCAIDARCKLFEAGVSDLEESLITHLWNQWEPNPYSSDSQCALVSETLAKAGSGVALTALDLSYAKVREHLIKNKTTLDSFDGQVDNGTCNRDVINTARDLLMCRQFLGNLKEAIDSMVDRGVTRERPISSGGGNGSKAASGPDREWTFEPGKAAYGNVDFAIKGKPHQLLETLAKAKRPLTCSAIRETVWDPEIEDTTLRGYVSRLRNRLRRAFNLSDDVDPIPKIDTGRRAAYRLDHEALHQR